MPSLRSVEESPPAFSWHPKITPYRLAFILTTGGLGIAKAVLVSRGQTASSITVEWIAAVVVALSLHFFGVYEYKPHRSAYIDWIFSYDCLDIAKVFMHTMRPHAWDSASPVALNQPDGTLSTDSAPNPPIVTAYRLLVSTSVSCFGLAKMLCAYLDFPAEMNTIDWIMAVPLTLFLYYVGLYEESQSSAPRALFDIEYRSQAILLLKIAPYYIVGVTPFIFWIGIQAKDLRQDLMSLDVVEVKESLWDFGAHHALTAVVITFHLIMVGIGAAGLGFVLWPIINSLCGRDHNSIRHYIVRVAPRLIFYSTQTILYIEMILLSIFHFGSPLFGPNANNIGLSDRIVIAFGGIWFILGSAFFAFNSAGLLVETFREALRTSKFVNGY